MDDSAARWFLMVLIVGVVSPVARGTVLAERIEYKDGGTTLVAHVAYDDAVAGKRPGVLVAHEWWGLNDYAKKRANQLAKLGYVGFALDMYGGGKTTDDKDEAHEWSSVFHGSPVMRRRARAALKALKGHKFVDPARTAAIGYCFGGTTVLQLAYSGAEIRGVVSFHGGVVAPTSQDIKRLKAKILICHGAEDPMVSARKIAAFRNAVADTKVDWFMVYYGGAKHSFTNNTVDKLGIEGLAYNRAAEYRSWQHMTGFLNELFGAGLKDGKPADEH